MDSLEKLRDWFIAVMGIIIMIAAVVRPNSANVINAMGASFGQVIKTMQGIKERDPLAVKLISLLSDNERTKLYDSLTREDLDWLDLMMKDVWPE